MLSGDQEQMIVRKLSLKSHVSKRLITLIILVSRQVIFKLLNFEIKTDSLSLMNNNLSLYFRVLNFTKYIVAISQLISTLYSLHYLLLNC